MIATNKIRQIVQHFEFLEAKLSSGADPSELARLSKEYADLKPVAEEARAYLTMLSDREAAQTMLSDPEMSGLAQDEIDEIEQALPEMEV